MRTASAEMRGSMRYGRRRLSVVYACLINRHHRYIGKKGSKPANPAMKCDLKVSIAFSVGLLRWLYGGTNCKSICFSDMNFLNALEHSLPHSCNFGALPFCARSSYIDL